MYSDVAIIGGGPAGLVAATLLARSGRKVVLLDRLPVKGHKVGESLPASVSMLLQTIELEPLNAPPHQSIPGSDSLWAGQRLRQDFIMQAQGAGWRLDRRRFEADLLQQARQSGVTLHQALLDVARYDNRCWELITDEGQQLNTKFVIDASGRRSILARMFSVPRTKYAPLVAFWAIGHEFSERKHKPTAQTLIESQEAGWWYAAFLPDQKPMAIFHTGAKFAVDLRRNSACWLGQLKSTKLISERIEADSFLGRPIYPCEARSIYLQRPYGENWAACGDAALSFDPLSSQGIFNAMASAEMLVKALLNDSREEALRAYHQRLVNIAEIYQRRRYEFYQRAGRFHQSEFWTSQLLDHQVEESISNRVLALKSLRLSNWNQR